MKTLYAGFGGLNPPEGRRDALEAFAPPSPNGLIGFEGVLQPNYEYCGKLMFQHAHPQTEEAEMAVMYCMDAPEMVCGPQGGTGNRLHQPEQHAR
jgi:hypothetical protein